MNERPALPPERRFLFISLALSLVFLTAALLVFVWALPLLRARQHLRFIMQGRIENQMLGQVGEANVAPEEIAQWRDHVRHCYLNPDEADLDRIRWVLFCRPTPFVGYALEPGLAETNEHQLRNSRPLALPKPDGVFRVFLLGGSLAYGAGAPSLDTTIAGFLERSLEGKEFLDGRRPEVFNAAVPSWTSTQERIRIENQISQWEPDMVVTLTGANDAHWGFEGRNALNYWAYEDLMYFELIRGAMRVAGQEPFAYEPPKVEELPIGVEMVAQRFAWNRRLTDLALAERNVPYLVALQPFLSPDYKPLTDAEERWLNRHEKPGKMDYFVRVYDAMLEAVARDGLEGKGPRTAVHDLRRLFSRREDPIYIDGLHVGDKGNQIIADALAALVENAVKQESEGAGVIEGGDVLQ